MKLFRSKKLKNLKPTIDVVEDSSVRNSASALFANIRFLEVDNRLASIVITSSVPNEGKSTMALALATAIGTAGNSCLLVEADMRRRNLATTLDIHPRYALGALLRDECTVEEAAVATEFEGVSFLNVEPGIPSPEALLDSKRFEALMAELASKFDYVIYDTPPLGAFSDAAVLAGKADGTILVVREGYTDRTEAQRSMEALNMANARVLGSVLNGQTSKNGSGYGYSYGYAYSYGYEEVPASDPRAQEQLAKQAAAAKQQDATEPAASPDAAKPKAGD